MSIAREQCYCDSPFCKRSLTCKQLGEYRIAHKVLRDLLRDRHHPEHNPLVTIQDALTEIECECEILVK